jgi:Protein of unknown function (DUF1275)
VAAYGGKGPLVSRCGAQSEERLAAGLAMLAGFVDAYGIITYNTYLSFMSGNTTQTGYRTGQGDFAAAVPSALAIVSFASGSLAGALIANSEMSQPWRLAFSVVAASLTLVIGLTQLGFLSDGVHIGRRGATHPWICRIHRRRYLCGLIWTRPERVFKVSLPFECAAANNEGRLDGGREMAPAVAIPSRSNASEAATP